MSEKDVNKENLHTGHRQRMKQRFIEHGADTFQDYELLEMILYYSIPKKDTNEIAHRLLDTFGTIKDVFDADYIELMAVKGIKENSATLIKLFQKVTGRYWTAEFSDYGRVDLSTDEKRFEYCKSLYLGEKNEKIYVLALDNNMHLMSKKMISEGLPNRVELGVGQVADFAIKKGSGIVLLVHNHPGGLSVPSQEDISVTDRHYSSLRNVGIILYDHIVVGCDGAISMKKCGFFDTFMRDYARI